MHAARCSSSGSCCQLSPSTSGRFSCPALPVRPHQRLAPARSQGPPPGGPTQYEEDLKQRSSYNYPPPPPRQQRPDAPPPEDPKNLGSFSKALVAAAFITGLGAGFYFDSSITLSPSNVASTEIVDRRTPNSELCMAYGSSAMVFDSRVFVSYNPFNVYVTQPEVKPGCVLGRSNFNVLENEKLVTNKQADNCKRRMNTFAFVGDLKGDPEISCVYHSEEAENQYLVNPSKSLDTITNPPSNDPEAPAATGPQ